MWLFVVETDANLCHSVFSSLTQLSSIMGFCIGQSENKEHLSKGFHTALRTSTTRNRRLTMKSFFYYILKNVKSELWYKVSLSKITCGTHQKYFTLVQSRITFINRNGNPADFI